MPKSNRAVGNAFEIELCNKLFEHGFWAHNLKQDNSGQPADVIAVRNGTAYLIDCKDCTSKKFDLKRVEDNQETAMTLWEQCGNGVGWFAIKISEEIYMIDFTKIKHFSNIRGSIKQEHLSLIGVPLGEWVKKCK